MKSLDLVDEVKKRTEKRLASDSTVKWPQEIEEALVIERNGWADSNMDYCVNCAARGNIKFRRSTSSWTKLIKSNSQISEESIRWSQWFLRSRWMIPFFRKINENSRNEETRFESNCSPFKFCFFDFFLLFPLAFLKFARRTNRLLAIER